MIEFEDVVTGSSLGSSIARNQSIDPSELINLNHDFTYSILEAVTDVKLGSVFDKKHDHGDNLSPDSITIFGNKIHVVEFATTKSLNINSLKSIFNLKKTKYERFLKERISKDKIIIFSIIITCPKAVYHNIPFLDQEIINELILRFRCSMNMEEDLIQMGYLELKQMEELERNEKIVKSIFQKFDFPSDTKLGDIDCGEGWSKESYDDFQSLDESIFVQGLIRNLAKQEWANSIKKHQPRQSFNKDGHKFFTNKKIRDIELKTREEINKYIESTTIGERRVDIKSAVQLPMVIPEIEKKPRDIDIHNLPVALNENSTPEEALFYTAFEYIFDFEENFETVLDFSDNEASTDEDLQDKNQDIKEDITKEEMDLKRLNKIIEFYDDKNKDPKRILKSKYHRIKLLTDRSDRVGLDCIGVTGTGTNLKDPIVSEYRRYAKVPFDLNCDTTDIEEFIYSDKIAKMLFDNQDTDYTISADTHIIKSLLSTALKFHQNDSNKEISDKLKNVITEYMNTNFYKYSKFISDVGTELTLSLRQHCRKDEFVLKKLLHWNCYLLIKPTNSEGHIFFSIYIPKTGKEKIICQKPFKNLIESEYYIITPFVSFNQHKLTNLVNFESRALTHFFYSLEMYQQNILNINHEESFLSKDPKCFSEIRLLTLIQLSDKSEVEAELTRSRFILLEGLVSYPEVPNPGKMLEKFNTIPRSRLTVFIIKRLIELIKIISRGRYIYRIISEEKKKDIANRNDWGNLIHPIHLWDLTDPTQLINSMYLGYTNNKNRKTEINKIATLFEKIIKAEREFHENYKKEGISQKEYIQTFGCVDKEDLKTHEYSPSYIKYITNTLIRIGKKQYGNNFLSQVERSILHSLSYLDIEGSLTTLKASSNYSPEKEDLKFKDNIPRSKVIEKTIPLIENELLVMELAKKSLEKIESDGAMYIDIFAKNQFGDPREIYVMRIYERIVQLIIETISRTICSFFKSETMTNPRSKTHLPEQHSKISNARYKGKDFLIVGSSDDAKQWNQTHYVLKFFQMLTLLTPSYMHPFLNRSLRLWMNKKIKIDQKLLDVFITKTNLKLGKEYIQEIYNNVRGLKHVPWLQDGKNFLKTRTGFMQGILHYTSSLLHTAQQESFREIVKRIYNAVYKNDLVMTILQSSDDSSVLLTIPASNKSELQRNLLFTSFALQLKDKLGVYAGIYPSIKCTKNTASFMEFNSQFFFDDSKNMPYIKPVLSCVLISEQESLQGRQEEMYNLITDIISFGGGSLLAFFCQTAQLLLNYRILGSSVNKMFKFLMNLLNKYPDPSLGFFLLDNPLITGIPGFKYNLWVCSRKSFFGKILKGLLNNDQSFAKAREKLYKNLVEVFHSGTIARKVILSFGNRKKWKKLIDESGMDDSWREEVNENPEILFRRSQNSNELFSKIALKLHSPGVTKAFDNGNILPRIIASSVYIINHNVLLNQGAWFNSLSETYVERLKSNDDTEGVETFNLENDEYQFKAIKLDKFSFLVDDLIIESRLKDNKEDGGLQELEPITQKVIIVPNLSNDYNYTSQNPLIKKIFKNQKYFDEVMPRDDGEYTIHRINNTTYIIINTFQEKKILMISDYYLIYKKLFKILKSKKLFLRLANYRLNIQLDIMARSKIEIIKKLIFYFIIDQYGFHDELKSLGLHQLILNVANPEILIGLFINQDVLEIFSLKWEKFSLCKLVQENIQNNISSKETGILTKEEETFLFPYVNDFIKLKKMLDSFNDISLHAKILQKTKKKTVINIFKTDTENYTPPHKIIGDLWFDLHTVNLSRNVKLNLFERYRKILDWLDLDPQVSLQQSPFEDFIQLFSWLTRNLEKTRSVEILGAPVNSRMGRTSLLNNIENNFSSSILLRISKDYSKIENIDQTVNLRHIIFMTALTPLKDDQKISKIREYLNKFRLVTFDEKKMNSKNNDLHILQCIQQNDVITHEILYKMKMNHNGIFGGYEIPQNFNSSKKKYEGFGSWKGIIDGNDVRLIINTINDENVLSAIILNQHLSESDIIRISDDLKFWCNEHNILMDSGLLKKLNKDYLKGINISSRLKKTLTNKNNIITYVDSSLITTEGNGLPVYLDKEMVSFNYNLNITNSEIIIEHNNLYAVFYQNVDNSRRRVRYKCLKYPIRLQDYDKDYRDTNNELQNEKILLKKFFTTSELTIPEITVLTTYFKNDQLWKNVFDEDTVKVWLNEMYQGSLLKFGIKSLGEMMNPPNLTLSMEEMLTAGPENNDLDVIMTDLTFLDEFDAELDQTMGDFEIEESSETSSISFPVADFDFTEFGETTPLSYYRGYSVLKVNPLLNNLVSYLLNKLGREKLSAFVKSKRIEEQFLDDEFIEFHLFITDTKISEVQLIDSSLTFSEKEYPALSDIA